MAHKTKEGELVAPPDHPSAMLVKLLRNTTIPAVPGRIMHCTAAQTGAAKRPQNSLQYNA